MRRRRGPEAAETLRKGSARAANLIRSHGSSQLRRQLHDLIQAERSGGVAARLAAAGRCQRELAPEGDSPIVGPAWRFAAPGEAGGFKR
jgi:hypothetical protein